jgi:hypothetical protein
MNALTMTRKQEKRCSLEQKSEFSYFSATKGPVMTLSPKTLREIGFFGQDSPRAAWGWNPRRPRSDVAEKAKARIRFQIRALHFLAVSRRLNFPPGRFNHLGSRKGREESRTNCDVVNIKLWVA